jgi:hypothetical protein
VADNINRDHIKPLPLNLNKMLFPTTRNLKQEKSRPFLSRSLISPIICIECTLKGHKKLISLPSVIVKNMLFLNVVLLACTNKNAF